MDFFSVTSCATESVDRQLLLLLLFILRPQFPHLHSERVEPDGMLGSSSDMRGSKEPEGLARLSASRGRSGSFLLSPQGGRQTVGGILIETAQS